MGFDAKKAPEMMRYSVCPRYCSGAVRSYRGVETERPQEILYFRVKVDRSIWPAWKAPLDDINSRYNCLVDSELSKETRTSFFVNSKATQVAWRYNDTIMRYEKKIVPLNARNLVQETPGVALLGQSVIHRFLVDEEGLEQARNRQLDP